MRAVEVGYRVVGFDLDVDRVKRLAAGDSYVEDVTDARLARRSPPAATGPPTTTPTMRRLRRGRHRRAHPAARRATRTSPTWRRRRPSLARHLRPGRHGDPRVDDLPGDDRGAACVPILEDGLGTGAPDATSTSATAPSGSTRATRPGARQHPQGGLGHRRRARWPPCEGFYDRMVERDRAGVGHPGGRADQAAREHLPPRQHRPGQRAGHVRRRPGIDVWEAIDAASTKPFGYMRFTPGPGVGGHCLPDRPELPVVEGPPQPRAAVPLRRAGQRRQRAHARLRRAPAASWPSTAWAGPVNGTRVLLLGLAYKRNTGDAREAPGTVIARALAALGAEVRVADPHLRRRHARPSRSSSLTADELAAADAVVLVTDHDAFDYDLVRGARALRPRHPEPPGRARPSSGSEPGRATWSSPAAPGSSGPISAGRWPPAGGVERGAWPSTTSRRGEPGQPRGRGRRRAGRGIDPRRRRCSTGPSAVRRRWSTWPPARRCPRSLAGPVATHEANATGTLQVLEAARRHGGGSTWSWPRPRRSTEPTRPCPSARTWCRCR